MRRSTATTAVTRNCSQESSGRVTGRASRDLGMRLRRGWPASVGISQGRELYWGTQRTQRDAKRARTRVAMRQSACPGTTDLLELLSFASFASFADKFLYSVTYDMFGESPGRPCRCACSRIEPLWERPCVASSASNSSRHKVAPTVKSTTYGVFGKSPDRPWRRAYSRIKLSATLRTAFLSAKGETGFRAACGEPANGNQLAGGPGHAKHAKESKGRRRRVRL